MRVEKIDREATNAWSLFWKDTIDRNSLAFMRSVEATYFTRKYIESGMMEGFKVIDGDNLIGFFGVKYSQLDTLQAVEFCDFIFNPSCRSKGYLNKLLQYLMKNYFKEKQVFIFFPINRRAMLTWKFALNPPFVERLNRWLVELDSSVKQLSNTDILFEKMQMSQKNRIDSEIWYALETCYKLYTIIWDKKEVGSIVLKEIQNQKGLGMEVYTLRMEEGTEHLIGSILEELFQLLCRQGYGYSILKVSESSIYNTHIQALTTLTKYKEVQYKFIVCSPELVVNVKKHNPITIGEELDIPRMNEVAQ